MSLVIGQPWFALPRVPVLGRGGILFLDAREHGEANGRPSEGTSWARGAEERYFWVSLASGRPWFALPKVPGLARGAILFLGAREHG